VFALLLALGLPQAMRAQEVYTLDELLALGREQSPTILALQAGQAALDADRRDAGRWQNPELEYETGSGDPFGEGGSRSLSGLTVRQVIENPLTRHFRMSALRSRVEAAGEGARAGALSIETEIRTHFYGVLFLQEILRLARLNEEALQAIQELIETRAEAGEVRRLEAIRLRVEHLRARNAVEEAQAELDQFRRHLNAFLGGALPGDFTLEGELSAVTADPDLDSLLSDLLQDHPEMRSALRNREAAQHELRASSTAWLPDAVLTSTSARELDGDVRLFGIGIQIPLWNQSRAASERDRQRVQQMTHREEALRLELQAQLTDHHNQLQRARRTIRLFQDGLLAEAETSMEIAETSYRLGEISFMEYLDARRTYHSIPIEFHQALYDWHRQRAALALAAGGGTY
jgi:cobalt-zinc-cadmium efflux system outer membrane protein